MVSPYVLNVSKFEFADGFRLRKCFMANGRNFCTRPDCAQLLLCFEKNYYILIWCVSVCACGGQKQLLRVYSSSYRSWELNLGHRSWSPAEPSHSPFIFSHVSLTTIDSYLTDFDCSHPRYHLLSPSPLTLSPFSTGPSSTPESSFPFYDPWSYWL